MTRYFFSIIILLILILPLFGQDWVQKMERMDTDFYSIQKSFNEYWKDRPIERGKGWKQFKRWEYFWEQRVYPSGQFPAPNQTALAMEAYWQKRAESPNAIAADDADWTSLGPDSWTTVSYNPGIGRVNCVVRDPNNSNLLYIGAPSGGFWKSTDGGATWYTTTDAQTVLGVTSIAIDPTNSDVIFIGTGDGDAGDTYSIGLLKSTDGGETWQQTGLQWDVTESRRISKVLIHPNNPNIMLAATNNGIYKSTDAGVNWSNVLSGNFKDMEFKPGDPSTVYASGSSFYKSTDTGDTFSESMTGISNPIRIQRIAIAVSSANSNYVYLLISDAVTSGLHGVYRSTDSGASFSLQANSPNLLDSSIDGSGSGGQGWYDLAIAVSPSDINEVYVGGVNTWKSTDGGVNWNIVGYWYYPNTSVPYVHADVHALEFYGSDLYAGSDGGLWVTSDGGSNWTDLSAGLVTTQFYRMGGYPGDAGLILTGAQDNGTNRYRDAAWVHVRGADGMEAAINYNNPDTMYCCIQSGGLYRSIDGGDNFQSIKNDIDEDGNWVTPYLLHPTDPQTLFAGYVNVWKTTDGGDSWVKLSDFGGSTLRSIAIAKSNPNVVYTATGNIIYRTTDGGSNWNDVTSNLPVDQASLTYIAVSDFDADEVWVTFSGYVDGVKVYKSVNGGANWSNVSGTLPNLPVNCIVFQNNYNDALYIGTDVGVYYTDTTLTDWEPFMQGLPNVIVDELEIHYGAGLLRAATYGRGMWQSPLKNVVSGLEQSPSNPQLFSLYQNYPNPFNPSTTISYMLERNRHITLRIYDMQGKEIRTLIDAVQSAGLHQIRWNGQNNQGTAVAGGVYISTLTSNGFKQSRKMILLR
ncbi:MAG TPA: T9SS type A sorting domain-containing protein [Caldithrix abyssi]|uniref:T9SS type A sorting domain-containing protein n=1 Tax=Caldithrix abyssi TaxID=187145 RepID=A0A7V4UBU5_CALAY|nr:T9SS type A sorting domain-containing protein [Caldithrix abyssi]